VPLLPRRLTQREQRLVATALELAAAGREDRGVVNELVASAGARRRTRLVRAADWIRVAAGPDGSRVHDRAYRVLVAAASDGAVKPVSNADDAWFKEIELLEAAPRADAYSMLERRQPALVGLREDLVDAFRNGVSGRDPDGVWDRLIAGLKPLAGPQAETDDAVVRSEHAFGICRVWLAQAAGLHLDSEEETKERLGPPIRPESRRRRSPNRGER
jgi:hypothetical protein